MDVSVIVPVYNIESYVTECIESLINQTFNIERYEIIIIDDGSTDTSLSVIKNKFSEVSNIKIFSKQNGGLSSVRNYGINKAIGKFIMFVDGDDFVSENFIETLYNNVSFNNLDVLFGSYSFYFDAKCVRARKGIELCDKVYSGVDLAEYLLKNKTFRSEVWDDIYNLEFLKSNKINFNENIIHEDELFTAEVIIKAKKIMSVNYNGYYYRQRQNSITKSANYVKRAKSNLIIINILMNLLNNITNKNLKKFMLWRINSISGALLINTYNSNINMEQIYEVQNAFSKINNLVENKVHKLIIKILIKYPKQYLCIYGKYFNLRNTFVSMLRQL